MHRQASQSRAEFGKLARIGCTDQKIHVATAPLIPNFPQERPRRPSGSEAVILFLTQAGERLLLGFDKLTNALSSDLGHALHLTAGKRNALRGALHLDKFSRTGHDEVHVDLGLAVFLITQ